MKFLLWEIKYIGPKFGITNRKVKKEVLSVWINYNNKIMAIKKHRELTGSSLREAKSYCDNLSDIANQAIKKKLNPQT